MNELAYLVLTNMPVLIASSFITSLIITLLVDHKTEQYHSPSVLRHILNVLFVVVLSTHIVTISALGLSMWYL